MNRKLVQILKFVITFSYFAILSYLVFFIGRRRGGYSYSVNLVPIKHTWREIRYITKIGRFNYFSNIFGNILLFIPLPFVLKFYQRVYKFSTVILIGALLSITIETTQYVFKVGVADIDDVILNIIGTCVGYFFVTQVTKPSTSLIL